MVVHSKVRGEVFLRWQELIRSWHLACYLVGRGPFFAHFKRNRTFGRFDNLIVFARPR